MGSGRESLWPGDPGYCDDIGVLPPKSPQVGPTYGDLRKGELIKIIHSRPLGRGGRERVKYRIVGDDALGWAEAASSWGGHVEAIIHMVLDHHSISDRLKLPKSLRVDEARTRPPQDLRLEWSPASHRL